MNDYIVEIITPDNVAGEWTVRSEHPTALEGNAARRRVTDELRLRFGEYNFDIRLNQRGSFHLRTRAGTKMDVELMKDGRFDNLRDAIREGRRQITNGWRAVVEVVDDADDSVAAEIYKNVTFCPRWQSKKPVAVQGLTEAETDALSLHFARERDREEASRRSAKA